MGTYESIRSDLKRISEINSNGIEEPTNGGSAHYLGHIDSFHGPYKVQISEQDDKRYKPS